MDNIGKRLEQDLKTALSRRRQLGRAVDKLPGPIGDNSPFADKADQTGLTAANGAAGTTIPVVENFELATSGPGLPPMLDLEKSSQGLDDER